MQHLWVIFLYAIRKSEFKIQLNFTFFFILLNEYYFLVTILMNTTHRRWQTLLFTDFENLKVRKKKVLLSLNYKCAAKFSYLSYKTSLNTSCFHSSGLFTFF